MKNNLSATDGAHTVVEMYTQTRTGCMNSAPEFVLKIAKKHFQTKAVSTLTEKRAAENGIVHFFNCNELNNLSAKKITIQIIPTVPDADIFTGLRNRRPKMWTLVNFIGSNGSVLMGVSRETLTDCVREIRERNKNPYEYWYGVLDDEGDLYD